MDATSTDTGSDSEKSTFRDLGKTAIKYGLPVLYAFLAGRELIHLRSKEAPPMAKHSRSVFETMHVAEKSTPLDSVNLGLSYFGFDWYMHPKTVHAMNVDTVVSANVIPGLCMTGFDDAKPTICSPTYLQRTDFCPGKKGDDYASVNASLVARIGAVTKADDLNAMRALYDPKAEGDLENACLCKADSNGDKHARLVWDNPNQADNCKMQQLGYHQAFLNDDASWSLMGAHSPYVLRFALILVLFVATAVPAVKTQEFAMFGGVETKKYLTAIIIGLSYFVLFLHRNAFILNGEEGGRPTMERVVPNGSYFYALVALTWYSWYVVFHWNDEPIKKDSDPAFYESASQHELKPIVPQEPIKGRELDVSNFGGKKLSLKNVSAYVHEGSNNPNKFTLDKFSSIAPSYKKWTILQIFVWPLIFLAAATAESHYGFDVDVELVVLISVSFGVIDWAIRRVFEGFRLYSALFKGTSDRSLLSSNFKIVSAGFLTVFTGLHLLFTTIAFGQYNTSFWDASYFKLLKEKYEEDGENFDNYYRIGTVFTIFLVYVIVTFALKFLTTLNILGYDSIEGVASTVKGVVKKVTLEQGIKWDTAMDLILQVFVIVYLVMFMFFTKEGTEFWPSNSISESLQSTANAVAITREVHQWSAGWNPYSNFALA